MAEIIANFYATNESKPSIFEIIAQKSLQTTLEPALRKVAEFLSACNSKQLNWLEKYYDESFLILNGFLQYHYLQKNSASFSEHFYGLRRMQSDDYELGRKLKCLSWVSLVVVPYLKRKLDEQLNDYRIQEAEQTLPQNYKGRLIRLLLFASSTFELTWGSWMLINYLRYMSNQTDAQLPGLAVLNLKLVYSNVGDDFQTFWVALFRGELSCSEISSGLVKNAVRSVLEVSAFLVQFLRAWNAEKANFNVTALPTVEAPAPDTKSQQYKERCPICMQFWKIPTVLPVSGYVYCFPCIFKHLHEHGKCPVTNLPARPLDIVRIYM